jgi:hypothetical protein
MAELLSRTTHLQRTFGVRFLLFLRDLGLAPFESRFDAGCPLHENFLVNRG